MHHIITLVLTFAVIWLPCHAESNKPYKGHLSLEFARTPDERATGLMNRHSMPNDHGMLFVYDTPQKVNVWMYNCYIDLSVAFINNHHIITEIHDLKAYPDAMKLPESLRTDFFQFASVASNTPVLYILEVPMGWFQSKGIKPGDFLELVPGSGEAFIKANQK